jgi:hypothetical protein
MAQKKKAVTSTAANIKQKTKGTNIPPTDETCVKTQSVTSDNDINDKNLEVKPGGIKKDGQPWIPGRKAVEEKLTPDFLARLTAYASQSISNLKIAEMIGISSASFYKLMGESPDFKLAYEKGIDYRKYELEKALIKRAEGYTAEEKQTVITDDPEKGRIVKNTVTQKNYVPDTTALIFSLKNLYGDKYKDRVESVNTVNINVQQIQNIPDEELLKYANMDLIEDADYQIE